MPRRISRTNKACVIKCYLKQNYWTLKINIFKHHAARDNIFDKFKTLNDLALVKMSFLLKMEGSDLTGVAEELKNFK